MATDSEPKSGTLDEQQDSEQGSTAVVARPKKKKLKRPRPPIPKTEDEIDSPTKQTVGMLGILGIMTVIMWALARGGCNYHPPKETRVPRQVATEELARDPKNAAIELQQRWLTNDFTGALELATGEVATQLQADKAACDAACLAKHKDLAAKVLTSAVILDANMMGANARVTSVGLAGGPKVFLVRMDRVESIWKASARKVDNGEPLPPLPALNPHEVLSPMSPVSSAAAPAGSASAAPSLHLIPPASGHAPPVSGIAAPASSK